MWLAPRPCVNASIKESRQDSPLLQCPQQLPFFLSYRECSCHEMWTEQLSRQPLLGLSFVFNLVLFPYFQTKARLSFSLIRGFYSHLSESMEHSEDQRFDFGKMEYGCKHYKRRCKIRAPCCNEVFACRHCHNKSTNALKNVHDRHELVRSDVRQVVCAVCETEQQAAQVCENCGVNMGEYFCDICKFYDDDTEKDQFHCNDCGICRVGGRENFFHCRKCGSCYSVALRDNHLCVENSMHHHCPICYEYLFDSLKDTRVLKCGHTMHFDCFREMEMRNQHACPICSKSLSDMTKIWQKMEQEIQETIMPEDYRYRKVWILCNDCNDTTEVYFHIIGHKCSHCNSYNTRTISPPAIPQ